MFINRTLTESIKNKLLHSNKIVVLYGPRQSGKTTLVNKILNTVQCSKVEINADEQKYVDILSSRDLTKMKLLVEKAFIVFRLPGFSRNLRKEVVKMDKIFFYDLGIRNTIIENYNGIEFRDDLGKLWENFVISERKKYLNNEMNIINSYFWRTYTGAELDFVEEASGRLNGFKIKWAPKNLRAPASWLSTYKEATFNEINKDNFVSFISEYGEK